MPRAAAGGMTMEALGPDSRAALHLLAYQYLGQGKNEKAHALLSLLLLQNPTDSELRLALAFASLRLGQVEEARDALAALEVSPLAAAHLLRGRAFALSGSPQEAENAFTRYRMLRQRKALGKKKGRVAPNPEN
jgi:tetratricopeptide (TPR) repeat protein